MSVFFYLNYIQMVYTFFWLHMNEYCQLLICAFPKTFHNCSCVGEKKLRISCDNRLNAIRLYMANQRSKGVWKAHTSTQQLPISWVLGKVGTKHMIKCWLPCRTGFFSSRVLIREIKYIKNLYIKLGHTISAIDSFYLLAVYLDARSKWTRF